MQDFVSGGMDIGGVMSRSVPGSCGGPSVGSTGSLSELQPTPATNMKVAATHPLTPSMEGDLT